MTEWQKHNMTEDEWRQHLDDYADYIDSIGFTNKTLKDKIKEQNAQQQLLHDQRRLEAINKVRELRRAQKEQAELNH